MQKQLVCVTGLPRAGSTLLCQLLAHHPDIYCDGHSSPLLPLLNGFRQQVTGNDFMMSQMDVDYETTYQRIHNMYVGLMDGWFAHAPEPILVDKNRGWLNQYDLVQNLKADTRMLVCVRNLEQIWGSIENRHQKSLLLDFPDQLAGLSVYDRADRLFGPSGVVGEPLKAIEALQDFHPDTQKQIYFVMFEDLVSDPTRVMADIFAWLGLSAHSINMQQLTTRAHESDSYYKFKYLHKTHESINAPSTHSVPTRIKKSIREGYSWFYRNFYPAALNKD